MSYDSTSDTVKHKNLVSRYMQKISTNLLRRGFAHDDSKLKLPEEDKIFVKNFYYGKKMDYILSHTCPYKYRPTHLFLPQIDQSTVDTTMEIFLDDVEQNIEYDQYYFGHYHGDERLWDKGCMLYYKPIKILED